MCSEVQKLMPEKIARFDPFWGLFYAKRVEIGSKTHQIGVKTWFSCSLTQKCVPKIKPGKLKFSFSIFDPIHQMQLKVAVSRSKIDLFGFKIYVLWAKKSNSDFLTSWKGLGFPTLKQFLLFTSLSSLPSVTGKHDIGSFSIALDSTVFSVHFFFLWILEHMTFVRFPWVLNPILDFV